MQLTWIDGRKLNSYTDGNLSITYKYNIDGIRTEKTVNGITTKYILEGTNIIYENRNNTVLYYFYDNSGVSGIKYNNSNYFFIKNLQGDIIRIVDSNNNILVKYEYDSFGNITSIRDNNDNVITDPTNIGLINPFRYRGYYYDSETGLYYLNSRYYNPVWGRFINADGIIGANKDLISQNLYAYCSNNGINKFDVIGDNAAAAILPTLGGAFIGFTFQFISNELNNEEYDKDLIPATIGGAVGGAVGSATGSWIIGTIAGIFVKNVIVEGIKTINKVNRKVNQNQCSMINEATLSISGLNILKNTAIESASSILIGKILRVKNIFPNDLDMQSELYDVTTNSIDISIKYISNNHVSYKLSDNSSYTNPYFKQTKKYLVRKEKKIVETTSGLCIIEWAD
jgi:RHS repeat-associated protein